MSDAGSVEETTREQRLWKKNVMYLYDTVVTKELIWPSLTVQWMPDVTKPEGSDVSVHRMLLGTHTAGEDPNQLMISKMTIPSADDPQFDASKWDSEREEFGGYGAASSAKLEHEIRINHPGEVHRARYMPHNPIIIASRGPFDDIFIFDYTKHPSEPHDNKVRAQLTLKGHEGEGYGMSWSTTREGFLITAGYDGTICLWDINKNQNIAGQITQETKFKGHEGNVEDAAFHPLHQFMFGSVGENKTLKLWDTRDTMPKLTACGHSAQVNCLSFNAHSEFLIATGSMDKTVALWDIRNVRRPVYSLKHHEDEVFQVMFSPHFETVLASSGSDDRVIVWDISRIQDSECSGTPPEVMFIHGGHAGKVADFSWNPNQPWMICSSDEYNKLHICLWDINKNQNIAGQITQENKFKGHEGNVEDAAFHPLHQFMFGSVGEDKTLKLWDTRDTMPKLTACGHSAQVNCLSFNAHSEFLIATGSMDKTVALWDIRNVRRPVYSLKHHEDEVFQVMFSPHFETVLASSGSDDRVIVWDISRIQDSECSGTPPEVMFIHGGHAGKVADFSWNPNQPWMICSSDEYNKLHTWEVSRNAIWPERSETEQ
uniref:WD_REPEATS_REGION domain-containing protein n=1 Tax=Caenorhabditis japonica TaxID=281687 RepID=A0A8R1HYE1_CAEJA